MAPSSLQQSAKGLLSPWLPARLLPNLSPGLLPWLLLIGLSGGCASAPPSLDFLDTADQLALTAASKGALEHAPLELKWAREKLTEARSAADGRDYMLARQLAQQSSVNSELAAAKTAAAKARDDARRARESNDALTIELGGGDL